MMTINGEITKKTSWDNPTFIFRRIKEQEAYIKEQGKKYRAGLMSGSRARELTVSATQMKVIYENRLKELYGRNNPPLQ